MNFARSRLGRIPIVPLLVLGLLIIVIVAYVNTKRTGERQARETAALRAENLRLRQEAIHVAEHQKADRERMATTTATAGPSAEPPIEAEPGGVLERVIQLKSYYARHPERGIPEMRLVTDDEWTQQARNADLDTEVGRRTALYMLRQSALNRSGRMVTEALKAFMAANPGILPADTAQLVPYLHDPEDAEYIAQFRRNDEPAPPVPTNPDAPPPVWVFKASPPVDPWLPFSYYVGQNGEQGMTSPKAPLYWVEDAVAQYRKASGTPPTNASQLVPYLKAPVSTPVLEDIFNGMKKTKD